MYNSPDSIKHFFILEMCILDLYIACDMNPAMPFQKQILFLRKILPGIQTHTKGSQPNWKCLNAKQYNGKLSNA